MKSCFLIVCLLVASVSAGASFDDELREFFEFAKQQMPCGLPTWRIPPLAPYKRNLIEFDRGQEGIDFTGNLTNLRIDGLNDFDITELTYSTLVMHARFDLHFNKIKIFSQYTANGGLQLFGLPMPLTGDGDFDLVLEHIRFRGEFRLRPTLKNGLRMYAFSSNLELDSVKSNTTGVMKSKFFSKFFNEWVEEFFRLLFEHSQDEINQAVGDFLVPTVNEYLKNESMFDLFTIVFGFGLKSEELPVCEV